MKYSGKPTVDFFGGRKKKVKINLNDEKSIQKALASISSLDGNITEKTYEYVDRLCEHGENYAKLVVPYDTGELKESIGRAVSVKGNKVEGRVFAGTDHAMFVEFGTGVRGEGTYPADLGGEWVYDVYEQNWQGHKAQPFMHDTAVKMQEDAMEIAKEVFGK